VQNAGTEREIDVSDVVGIEKTRMGTSVVEQRFDGMTRRLSETGSRREMVRTLAAGGLGLGLAGLGLHQAKAGGGKNLGARCKKSNECKGGYQCKKANSQNSCFAKTEKRCCKPIGAKCNDGCECCGVDVICNGGYCDQA
jgi:hypothetical protein